MSFCTIKRLSAAECCQQKKVTLPLKYRSSLSLHTTGWKSLCFQHLDASREIPDVCYRKTTCAAWVTNLLIFHRDICIPVGSLSFLMILHCLLWFGENGSAITWKIQMLKAGKWKGIQSWGKCQNFGVINALFFFFFLSRWKNYITVPSFPSIFLKMILSHRTYQSGNRYTDEVTDW